MGGIEGRRRVVLLYSDTGGGHRSAALAIRDALDNEFPGRVEHTMVDLLRDYTRSPFTRIPDTYGPLTRVPGAWATLWHGSNGRRRQGAVDRMIWPYVRRRVVRLLDEHPADLYLSVHPLASSLMARAMVRRGVTVPYRTVVTDLVTAHVSWFLHPQARYVVASAALEQRAISLGVAAERVAQIGIPVASRFSDPTTDRRALRRRFGWAEDRLVVVITGGGDGMGPVAATARAIDRAELGVTLVIVTGRNEGLRRNLEGTHWRGDVHVLGFVDTMPEMMLAADALVAKAGPNTISEACAAGLPMILCGRLAGQERGNEMFVVDAGAGVWAPRPELAVAALRRWIDHPDERSAAGRAAAALARPHAARDIARWLGPDLGLASNT